MIAPHLNPAIDAHMRFRLALQVSNVQRLMQSPRSVWSVSFCLREVRRFRQAYPYGWQVAGTTLDNLFREHKVPWDDEDEEKVAAGHNRGQTWQDRVFWRTWVADRPAVTQKAGETLQQALSAVATISELNQETSSMATQQAAVSKGISGRLDSIQRAGQENLQHAQTVSDNCEELVQQISRMQEQLKRYRF